MKKNVAGQIVGAQMVSATTGAAFTSAVTVAVTGDGGTQATGSVGSGACTHEGNGYHTYAPAQAETNYDLCAFTFTGTGAVPATVQIYTSFPQSGDNYARIGPAVGSPTAQTISEDLADIKVRADTYLDAAISSRAAASLFTGITSVAQWLGLIAGKHTGNTTARTEINATGAGSGSYDETTDSTQAIRDRGDAAWTTATGFSTHSASDVWAVGTRLLTAGTNIVLAKGTGVTGFNDLDAAGVRGAVGLASANLDTQLDALPTAAENATAVWASGTRTLTALDEDNTTLDLDGTIRAAVGMASADLDTQLDAIATAVDNVDNFVDTEVAAIKATTDKLDTLIEAGSPAGYEFTATALQNAPLGSGASAAAIADAVWDEALAGHLAAGSTGEQLNNAASAGNPWSSIIEGSYTAEDILRILAAVAAGKTSIVTSGNGSAVVVFRDITDASDIVTANMTNSERASITLAP